MNPLKSFAITAAFGFAFLNGTLVPPQFCQGVRHQDKALYGPWIEEHAITKFEAAQLNDPVIREQYRRERSKTWKAQVRNGQAAKCGKASF